MNEKMNEESLLISKKAKIALIILGALIVLVVFNPFVQVPAGKRGLVFNWGGLSDKVLDQGLRLRIPIMQKVTKITIQPIQLDYTVTVGSDGAITEDNQTVGAYTTVFYQYDEKQLVSLWRDYGLKNIESLVQSSVKESFKEQIGGYTIFDIAQKQEELREKVVDGVRKKLAAYPITITELRIQNYDWSDEFDKQIEETMSRAQKVRQAEQDLLIAQQQAQKQVKEAEAAKQATVTKAEGARDAAKLEAEAKALEGEGIKKYNDSIAANLEVQLRLTQLEIERIKAERWNGQFVSVNNYGPIPVATGGLLPK